MGLTKRQEDIINIIKSKSPITGQEVAEILGVSRSALRTDFSILTNKKIILAKPRRGYVFIGQDMKEYVGQIMSPAVFVSETTSVYDTLLKMFSADVGSVFIANDGNLSGIVSRKDLLKISIGKTDISKIPISLIMTRMPNIVYSTADEKIIEAVKKIIIHEIDSLPVIEKETFKLVGRITKTNITKLFLELNS